MKGSQSVKDLFLSIVNGKQKEKSREEQVQQSKTRFTCNSNEKSISQSKSLNQEVANKKKSLNSRALTLPRQFQNEEKNLFYSKQSSKSPNSYATLPRSKCRQNFGSLSDGLETIKKFSSFKKKRNTDNMNDWSSRRGQVDQDASSRSRDTHKLGEIDYSTTSSKKLKACLEKLEKMSLQLNNASDVSTKLEEFQTTADLLLSAKHSNLDSTKPSASSSKQRFFGKRKKRKQSVESSSDDSGSLSDCNKLPKARLNLEAANNIANQNYIYCSSDNSSIAQQSISSGYYSENSSLCNPSCPSLYYPYPLRSLGSYGPSLYHQRGFSQTPENYGYNPESSYYHPESVSSQDEHLYNEGWIYLPFRSNEEPIYHYNVFQDPYPEEDLYSSSSPQLGSPECSAASPQWKENHEAGNFLKNSEIKAFGSFRYRNGEQTIVGSQSGSSGKRVRFSKTVKKGKDCEAEVEKETSQNETCDMRNHQSTFSPQSSAEESSSPLTLSQQPIYEFPSGHIEQSCMCSDCILARQSSQLKPAVSFAYY